MSNKIKDINIKNRTYYLFNDIISIENFDPNNIKFNGTPSRKILIYSIGYARIKKYLEISSVNPSYLIFNKINEYFEELNGSKYLTLVLTNESEEKIKKI